MAFVAAHLHGWAAPAVVRTLLRECAALRNDRQNVFHSSESHTPFLEPAAAGTPAGHIRARQVSSEKVLIAGDRLPSDSLLPGLYAELMPVVARAMGVPRLYPHGDLMNRYYYNVYKPGHQLGWHFDNSTFGVNLLLQPARDGGALQHAACAADADVAAVVDGGATACVRDVPLGAGDVVVFRGQRHLHRVSPVGAGERVNVIMCYGSAPGERLHADTKRQFFGRG